MGFEEVEFGSRRAVAVTRPPAGLSSSRRQTGKTRSAPVKAKEAKQTAAPAAAEPTSVLVPLDQWTSLLNQLGSLHQAGQQMADARERAAKAETEALFLKERLRELREELARARAAANELMNNSPAPNLVEDQAESVVDDGSDESGPRAAELTVDLTTDRVLVVKLPSRLTKWWLERRS